MRIQILSLILGLGSLIGAPAFAQNVQVQSEQRPQMDSMGFQTNFGDFGTKSEYRNGSGAEIVDTQNNTQLRTSGQMNSAYGTPDGNVLPAVSGTGTYLQNNDSIQADQFGLEQSAADPTAPSVDPLELRQPPAAPVPVQINQP